MRANEANHPQAEARLIARAQDGDERAFETIFHTYERRVYSLCVRMTGDLTEAEDLTQETFLQLFRRISTFRNESAFSTWLHRVTVNVVLMHLRRKRLQVPLERPDEYQQGSCGHEYGADDPTLTEVIDHIILRRAMGRLSEGRQAVLVLHDVEGYRHAEIANLLDCSIGNSKSQLCRARGNMRALLLPASTRKDRPGN